MACWPASRLALRHVIGRHCINNASYQYQYWLPSLSYVIVLSIISYHWRYHWWLVINNITPSLLSLVGIKVNTGHYWLLIRRRSLVIGTDGYRYVNTLLGAVVGNTIGTILGCLVIHIGWSYGGIVTLHIGIGITLAVNIGWSRVIVIIRQ